MTIDVTPSANVRPASSTAAESRLRAVLLANVAFSIVSGGAGVILGGPVADALGIDQVWLIRLLGAGLLGFAGVVFLVARSARPALETWSLPISMGDMGWVLGTIVVIAFGWLSSTGAVIMAVIAAAVLGLGAAQYGWRQKMLAATSA